MDTPQVNPHPETPQNNDDLLSWFRCHPKISIILGLILLFVIIGIVSGDGYDPDNAPFGADEAFAYHKKYCDKDNMDACNKAGQILYFQKKYSEALTFYEKSCKLGGNGACYNAGLMYKQAQGTIGNLGKFFEYMQKSCDLGYSKSCVMVAEVYHSPRNYNMENQIQQNEIKTFEYYQKGCELNDGEACYWVGVFFHVGYGGIVKDMKRAMEFFRKSCKLGDKDNGCSKYKDLKELGY